MGLIDRIYMSDTVEQRTERMEKLKRMKRRTIEINKIKSKQHKTIFDKLKLKKLMKENRIDAGWE